MEMAVTHLIGRLHRASGHQQGIFTRFGGRLLCFLCRGLMAGWFVLARVHVKQQAERQMKSDSENQRIIAVTAVGGIG